MIHIPPSLKHRRFFYLWSGQLLSIAGTQMQIWALFWHIRTLTDQPIALGGVGLARILPIIIFSLVGGVIADSIERHRGALRRNERRLHDMLALKAAKDRELNDEVKSYDSAQLAALRGSDRRVATLEERIVYLQRLAAMPAAIARSRGRRLSRCRPQYRRGRSCPAGSSPPPRRSRRSTRCRGSRCSGRCSRRIPP